VKPSRWQRMLLAAAVAVVTIIVIKAVEGAFG